MGNDGSKKGGTSHKLKTGGGGRASIADHLERAAKTGVVNLSSANIKNVPDAVEQIAPKLRNVDISGNKITELPSFVQSMVILKQLRIGGNQLAALPDEIGCVRKLELLAAQRNQIARLPDSMVALSSLKTVDLSHNQLAHFPSVLCDLTSLEALDLSHNRITTLDDCDKLERLKAAELNLNNNRLNALSPRLSQCARLIVLRLQENCLPLGEITPELLESSKISTLEVDGNLFSQKQLQGLAGYDAFSERYTNKMKKTF